jgi:hypothetical protein
MSQETITYLTNIVIAVILAGMLTHSWLAQGRTEFMRLWMISAWVIVGADVLFALRPELPNWFGRFFPTLMVTVSHVGLLLGALATAQRKKPWAMFAAVIVVHGAALVYFLSLEQPTHWRMVTNGLFWSGLAIAGFFILRRAPAFFWDALFSPANVFLLHAAFHLARVGLAISAAAYDWPRVADALQILGDLEASFFTVALFVSLLIAALQLRHAELSSVRAEVETLSGLLPICAWCKKVRDDAGYWQQVEDYFERRDRIRFTHGICADCADNFKEESVEPKPVAKT